MRVERSRLILITGLLAAGFVACSHGTPAPGVPSASDSAKTRAECARLQKDMALATRNQIDFFSPIAFNIAAQALEDARTSLESKDGAGHASGLAQEARTQLARANEVASRSSVTLSGVARARRAAIAAGANGLFVAEFKKADRVLLAIASDLEQNNSVSAVTNRDALRAAYRGLEVSANEHGRDGPVREWLQMAE